MNGYVGTAGGVQETELNAQTKHCLAKLKAHIKHCSAKRDKSVKVSKSRLQKGRGHHGRCVYETSLA